MVTPERSTTPISASIAALRRQMGLGRSDTVADLRDRWPEFCGEAVAARSWVVDLRDGRLNVDADDPPTAEALRWARERVLDGARAAHPRERILDLTVRVRRRPPSDAPAVER